MSDVASVPLHPVPHRTWGKRLAQAWSAGALPVVLLPAIAVALGPEGLTLIGAGVASLLDPAVPVALATIGALAALQIPSGLAWSRVGAATLLEAALAGVAVAAGIYLLGASLGSAGGELWLTAAACGACAAASSPLATADAVTSFRREALVRDFDFLLPVIAGALLLAWMHHPDPELAGLALAKHVAASAVVGVAGILLATSAASPGEQRVFGMASILLLGGIADALGLSALLSGLSAGVIWRASGGTTRETLIPVIAYIQHPLLILMLLVAGIRVQFTVPVLSLAAAYVVLRMAAKMIAGSFIAPLIQRPRSSVAAHLVSPGVFGVALVLTFGREADVLSSTLVTVVVVGTAFSQLLQALAFPSGQR